jgi:predicted acylesterase/phospholipase RssA
MTIKSLVISGGGPTLIQTLGSLQQLEKDQLIDLRKIESIYGTSAGAIVGIIVCLKYDFETIYEYIVKRPWQNVFQIKIEDIFDAYTKKGIFDIKTIEKCFKPLFDEKEISIDINFEDFYKKTNIEFHLYAFDINEYKVEDMSYITHPKLSLLKGIQMTCGIPILMKPVCIDNKCFIDGGILCNYPLNYAIQSGKNADEILGFKNKYNANASEYHITEESSLLDFLMKFLFKAIFSLNTDDQQPKIKNEISCEAELMSLESLKNALNSKELRKKMWCDGMNTAILFTEKQIQIQTQIHENINPIV